MKICGVYMIEHTATGRRYIGKSVDVDARISAHFQDSRLLGSVTHIHSAIKKYGKEAFLVRLLEVCQNDAAARSREVQLIAELGTKSPHGFNITDGGDGVSGLRHSEESKRKCSARHTGNKYNVGRKLSLAHIDAIRSANAGNKYNAGRKPSSENLAKLRAVHVGNTYNVGKRHSESTKAKMSESQRARRLAEKAVSQ